jgi:hypothetical protein
MGSTLSGRDDGFRVRNPSPKTRCVGTHDLRWTSLRGRGRAALAGVSWAVGPGDVNDQPGVVAGEHVGERLVEGELGGEGCARRHPGA